MLTNKIDFAVVFSVRNANPNGDPLNGNRPRINYDSHGEVSDVCIKRKIRNRLLDMGENILIQSDDYKKDEFTSIKARAESVVGNLNKGSKANKKENAEEKTKQAVIEKSCQHWIDVRAFGQVMAFKGSELSIGIRGPVSVHTAVSLSPLNVSSMQITKSTNSVDGDKKGPDTMGQKHRIDFGVYVFYGSINPQLSEKTGFNDDDAEKIKAALLTLFENDASSARPEGSMAIVKVYWWRHNNKSGQCSSAKIHRSLKYALKEGIEEAKQIEDYDIFIEPTEVACEEYEGM